VKKLATRWTESPEDVASFRLVLLDFYDAHGRALPWRSSRDPYAILVSEMMAQQTRVETVIPYYRRWLDRFPTVEALALAPEDDVLKAWEGLGYYSRARNLHRAAKVVREEHDGRLPDTVSALRDLPGIGPYTAGAVASIAFSRAEPAVDGNVRRVYARLFDQASPSPHEVTRWATEVVDPGRPGDFNQALMELGATVCVPRRPSCHACPVAIRCRALAEGTVELRPRPKKRAAVRRELRQVVVLLRGGEVPEVLMTRRPGEGLLAGLWEFPSRLIEPLGDPGDWIGEMTRELDLRAHVEPPLPEVSHLFTHLHVTYRPALVLVNPADDRAIEARDDRRRGPASGARDQGIERWVPLDDLGGLAVPTAQRRIAELARDAREQRAG
jgi:A/G-specific adenine glycosylase